MKNAAYRPGMDVVSLPTQFLLSDDESDITLYEDMARINERAEEE